MADGSVVIETKLDTDGVNSGVNKLKGNFSKLGSIASTAIKGATVAIGAATAAITGLVTTSANAYAEYEQLVGGVDTLFKESSKDLQKYADEAYKNAGLSANEYMETATSFSASLLQSLGGDTKKAVEYANDAIIDMADNANKMGTDIKMIQNAYQGFAKGNFTMLDNLKLGYGGTKTEMERLIKKANEVKKANGEMADLSIESFADITEAIHIIQDEMGIAGATSQEASTTITGSVNAMKGAWHNLLVGMSNDEADMSKLIDNFVDSIGTVAENLLPTVEQALVGIGTLIEELLPIIVERIPVIFNEVIPKLLNSGISIVQTLVKGINENLPLIVETAITIIMTLINGILPMLPDIVQMGITLLVELINGISEAMPELAPKIVECILLINEVIYDNLDVLTEAGITLIIALIEGIIKSIPELLKNSDSALKGILNVLSRWTIFN